VILSGSSHSCIVTCDCPLALPAHFGGTGTQVHLGAITTTANVPGYVETRPFNTHHYQLTDR
jgi:hypothetical protein